LTNTENEFGSDNVSGYEGPVRIDTTAIIDGDEWVVNGTKQWSSGSGAAELFLVLVRTEGGRATMLVPSNTPGVLIGTIHEKLGERFAINAEVVYDNVRLPKENMLGKPQDKPDSTGRSKRLSNPFIAACALGLGRAAYEAALDYAKARVQGGKKIIEHQAIGMMLADMYAHLEAARLLYLKSAWMIDHDEYYDPKLHTMSKAICSEVALKVAIESLEIHGGYGSTKDFPMEKYVRDAVTFLHSDGTRQALKLRTASCLVKGL
jgi:alkylation response protein AidB-like acyl-CoA dehydrogenase